MNDQGFSKNLVDRGVGDERKFLVDKKNDQMRNVLDGLKSRPKKRLVCVRLIGVSDPGLNSMGAKFIEYWFFSFHHYIAALE